MRITGTKMILSNEPLPFPFPALPYSFLPSFSLKRLSPLETQFESNRRRRRVTRGFRFVRSAVTDRRRRFPIYRHCAQRRRRLR